MQLAKPRLSRIETDSGVSFYSDERLFKDQGILLGFTERSGGLSPAPFDSLNLGRFAGEGEKAAFANARVLTEALGITQASLVWPTQVHGTNIVQVTSRDEVSCVQEEADEGADGVVVSAGVKDVLAILGFADCVPVIAVSPEGAYAVVHAGWRGVHAHIVPQALKLLGAPSKDCNIYIGPYIHEECFEVGPDTYALFETEFGSDCLIDHNHVNLGKALRADLYAMGISDERIADLDMCTVCNTDKFFSYRSAGGTTGRHSAFCVCVQ